MRYLTDVPVQAIKNAHDQLITNGTVDCTICGVHAYTTSRGSLYFESLEDGTYMGRRISDRLLSDIKEIIDKVLW